MTTQIAVKLPDDVVAEVDAWVLRGRFTSRSEAFRVALDDMLRHIQRSAIDESIVEGYERHPETATEMADVHRLSVETIDEEPWDKWW